MPCLLRSGTKGSLLGGRQGRAQRRGLHSYLRLLQLTAWQSQPSGDPSKSAKLVVTSALCCRSYPIPGMYYERNDKFHIYRYIVRRQKYQPHSSWLKPDFTNIEGMFRPPSTFFQCTQVDDIYTYPAVRVPTDRYTTEREWGTRDWEGPALNGTGLFVDNQRSRAKRVPGSK